MRVRKILLDGATTKAYRVLKARLSPLGIEVRTNPPGLPDPFLDRFRLAGYVIVSSDKESNGYGWVYIPHEYVLRKSARDLSTHIIKIVLGRR